MSNFLLWLITAQTVTEFIFAGENLRLHGGCADKGKISLDSIHDVFKSFEPEKDIKSWTKMKSSEERRLRSALLERYPHLEPLLRRPASGEGNAAGGVTTGELRSARGPDGINFLAMLHGEDGGDGSDLEILFFGLRDSPHLPTLRLLHRFPTLLPHFWVDTGAVKFVLSGAQVMGPGLREMEGNVGVGEPVAVMVQGREHALAIGWTLREPEAVRKSPKGPALAVPHRLTDGLWRAAAPAAAAAARDGG